MHKSRVIALVVASLVSSASLAQAQSAAPAPRAERHQMRDGMWEGRGHMGLLRGITLSDAEKARLKEIHGKYAAEGQSLRESLKPAMQEARADRQKGDTAAARAVWERNKGAREQVKALHDREKAEIRGALTPENQKLFDANVATLEQRRAEGRKGGHRGMKGDNKGQRAGGNG